MCTSITMYDAYHCLIYRKFDVGANRARIGVFRYNKVVDRTTEIKLNESVDVDTLMERIDAIPYDGSGITFL